MECCFLNLMGGPVYPTQYTFCARINSKCYTLQMSLEQDLMLTADPLQMYCLPRKIHHIIVHV
jgi:hypothetical protein